MPLYSVFLGFGLVGTPRADDIQEFLNHLPSLLPSSLDVHTIRFRSPVDVELLVHAADEATLREWLQSQSTMTMQELWDTYRSAIDVAPSQMPLSLYSRSYMEAYCRLGSFLFWPSLCSVQTFSCCATKS
jgi:hypothetical protein